MTIMLQAGFLLVLVTAFYLLLNFYTKTQQVLTARNHAERVIQFVDDKIRHAGLGLWQCSGADGIRSHLNKIPMLHGDNDPQRVYNLPISVTEHDGTMDEEFTPEKSSQQLEGNVLTLLYAERDVNKVKVGGEEREFVLTFVKKDTNLSLASDKKSGSITVTFLEDDNKSAFISNQTGVSFFRVSNDKKKSYNLKRWGVAEAIGLPFFVDAINYPNMKIWFYDDNASLTENLVIPDASEAMYLRWLQMYVWTDTTSSGAADSSTDRHFVWRELTEDGDKWMKVGEDGYGIQEDNILDIYVKLDQATHILTLYVLASGGTNDSSDTPRPDAWPKEAEPKGSTDDDAKEKWLESDYKDHVVYVARKSWKVNNY